MYVNFFCCPFYNWSLQYEIICPDKIETGLYSREARQTRGGMREI